MRLAVVFPGQGSQAVGMGREAAEAYPEAREVFDAADEALGERFARLVWEGSEQDLRRTENTQPAILTCSLAIWSVLERHGVSPLVVAGHSLGEYSALVAARALTFRDAVRAVRQRGRFMQEAVPEGEGAMAAILQLPAERVAEVCAQAAAELGQVVAPANFNSPEQTVISGHTAAVARASELALAAGAKRALPLPVSAPFHCSLMQPAAERLKAVLAAIEFDDPSPAVITNVDASEAETGAAVREALVRQVSAPVRWVETVARMVELGVTDVLEVGPGAVLGGLVRRIDKSLKTHNAENTKTLTRFLETYDDD